MRAFAHKDLAENGLLTGRLVALNRFLDADSRICVMSHEHHSAITEGVAYLLNSGEVEDHQLQYSQLLHQKRYGQGKLTLI